jgi:RHS repeat-associated protein
MPNGAIYAVEHDADGRIAAYIGPDGATWRLRWGGYNCVHTLEKPTGEALRFRYDREGNLVQVVNERGETHRIERDCGGRIVAETFFDGRAYRYRLDAAGRLLRHENGAGERTELERDACGRILRREYDDGTSDAFEYDAVGRLVRADNGTVCCTWSYDARGNVVRETQACEGRTVRVEHTYNAANQCTSTRANLGYAVSLERDEMGRAARVRLDRLAVIDRTFDTLGREVVRSLPGGGHIVCRYDSFALTERRIEGPRSERDPAEPAWVGRLPRETTFAEGFACSITGDVTEHTTITGERERFAYDPAGRIAARSTSAGAREVYAYEGTGRAIEPLGPAHSYGPGGVLLSRGTERFAYDAEGRRTMKVDDREQATRYEWNGRGMLAAVVLPDGSRVENVYDTQGRRVVKRVRRPDGSRTETRFAWAGDDMIHEITWSIAPSSPPAPVVARAYVHDDDGAPLAHHETTWTNGAADTGEWIHYALGPGEMPALLIAGDGAILARLRASVWGRVEHDTGAKARTPWRFPGQYEDEETGLFYNRYRFYDPAIGLYVSPDPIGLMGGPGSYEYARAQPLRIIDPSGLASVPVTSVVTGHGITGRGKSAGLRGDKDPFIHPIVGAAMPQAQNGIYPNGDDRPPSNCAEPVALSSFIKKWEDQNNGGRQLDPSNPNDTNKIKKCLGSIKSISAQHTDGLNRAPCPNCSAMIQNLHNIWGVPKDRVVQPGLQDRPNKLNPNPPTVTFSPPKW